MSEKQIVIEVRGRMGVGKSTVAAIVAAALKKAGLTDVVLEDTDHRPWTVDEVATRARVLVAKLDPPIRVTVASVNRVGESVHRIEQAVPRTEE